MVAGGPRQAQQNRYHPGKKEARKTTANQALLLLLLLPEKLDDVTRNANAVNAFLEGYWEHCHRAQIQQHRDAGQISSGDSRIN